MRIDIVNFKKVGYLLRQEKEDHLVQSLSYKKVRLYENGKPKNEIIREYGFNNLNFLKSDKTTPKYWVLQSSR